MGPATGVRSARAVYPSRVSVTAGRARGFLDEGRDGNSADVRADDAACSGTIVDHDGLAECALDLARCQPAHQVGV